MNVTATVVLVTPDMARAWLNQNPRNRNVTTKHLDTLIRAMRNGEWKLNGEAIKRAHNGDILDGQHRLTAVVESGVSVEMLVVEGLEPETQDTMDAGRKRTTADVFAIHGETNANVLASTARRVWQWEAGNYKFAASSTATTAELQAVLKKHSSLRRSADIGTSTNATFKAAGATVTATAHHILLGVDQDTAALFFARLGSGADLGEGDPVLTLRNRLMRDRLTAKAVPFHLNVAMYFRAWNAMREGRPLERIIHTAEEPMVQPR